MTIRFATCHSDSYWWSFATEPRSLTVFDIFASILSGTWLRPFRVTGRHRALDRLIHQVPFPIGAPLPLSVCTSVCVCTSMSSRSLRSELCQPMSVWLAAGLWLSQWSVSMSFRNYRRPMSTTCVYHSWLSSCHSVFQSLWSNYVVLLINSLQRRWLPAWCLRMKLFYSSRLFVFVNLYLGDFVSAPTFTVSRTCIIMQAYMYTWLTDIPSSDRPTDRSLDWLCDVFST